VEVEVEDEVGAGDPGLNVPTETEPTVNALVGDSHQCVPVPMDPTLPLSLPVLMETTPIAQELVPMARPLFLAT